jgi:hypothetical protein
MRSSFVAFNFYLLFSLIYSSNAQAKNIRYFGEARKNDQVVYREFHEVNYDKKNKLIKSKTTYKAPDGTPLSELESDFSESHSLPAHTLKDFISKRTYGIRYENNEGIMFHKNPEEIEKTNPVPAQSDDELLVAAEGLHYYILENFELVMSEQKIPIKFILPSVFDYCRFNLQVEKEMPDEIVEFSVKIKSFWLKLFAPKMILRYNKAQKKLLYYKGLSNIRDKNGDRQVVEINYSYDN